MTDPSNCVRSVSDLKIFYDRFLILQLKMCRFFKMKTMPLLVWVDGRQCGSNTQSTLSQPVTRDTVYVARDTFDRRVLLFCPSPWLFFGLSTDFVQ